MIPVLLYLSGICLTGLTLCVVDRLLGNKPSNWDTDEFGGFIILSVLSWVGFIIAIILAIIGSLTYVAKHNGINNFLLKDRHITKLISKLLMG